MTFVSNRKYLYVYINDSKKRYAKYNYIDNICAKNVTENNPLFYQTINT